MLNRLNVFFLTFKRSINSTATVKAAMQEGYITINNVPTHLFTYGKWVEEKFEDSEQDIVLIITGNPGD